MILKNPLIQTLFTANFLSKKLHIIPSQYQSKEWRLSRDWYKNGFDCEKYQRNLIENIIEKPCLKTQDRINLRNYNLKHLKVFKYDLNGLDWSENFDGKVNINNNIYYFNFKMICSEGGSQNRSCRENYWFINSQINYLETNNINNIYFLNILDGDINYKNLLKYKNLSDLYLNKKKNLYIGDLFSFNDWWCKHLNP